MIPASRKLDFCSLLTNFLRERKYNVHIVKSNKLNPNYTADQSFDEYYYLPCVEVGTPKPAVQFMVDPALYAGNTSKTQPKGTCYWRSYPPQYGSHHATKNLSYWYPICTIHDPELFDTILEIIHTS
jgi:hypothetical protein